MKVTFLSKWTVLILTAVTAVLFLLGLSMTAHVPFDLGSNVSLGVLLYILAVLVYAVAWIIGFLDSIQERRFGWTIGLVLLMPFLVGPLFYSLLGPRNTK
jgi:hypothetical protein